MCYRYLSHVVKQKQSGCQSKGSVSNLALRIVLKILIINELLRADATTPAYQYKTATVYRR